MKENSSLTLVSMTSLDIPLECQYPKEFGKMDDEQKNLVSSGALDLVLIENASELVRLVMMDGENLEILLRAISGANKGCSVLPSETFSLWMDPDRCEYKRNMNSCGSACGVRKKKTDVIYHDFPEGDLSKEPELYWRKIEPLKKMATMEKKKKGCIFSLFAVDLGGPGHYAAFYWECKKGQVMIFDSMQADGNSRFTPFFRQLAIDIFGVQMEDAIIPECFSKELCLQLTGGFEDDDSLMMLKSRKVLTLSQQKQLRIESTESQNHFCYMWGIWYLHHKMMGLDPLDSAKEMIETQKTDPLIIIKRYIWAIFHLQLEGGRLIDQIDPKYKKFFEKHFPAIWSNDPEWSLKINFDFQRYKIGLATTKTINECLALSLRKASLEKVAKTDASQTKKLCKLL